MKNIKLKNSLLVCIFLSLFGFAYAGGNKHGQQKSDYARVTEDGKAAVATVNPYATQAAINAIKKGGNAVDAALAAAFTLGVVDSHNSGVGGGCFILAHLANGQIIALDGREMAPGKAHRMMYMRNGKVEKNLSRTGALASGIPGSVQAFYEIQKKAGKLNFSDVLLPAAAIAEKGFNMDKTMAMRLNRVSDRMQQFPASAAIYLDKNKMPLKEGDLLVQKDLAKSYRALAKHGPKWFYRGDFAEATAKWMKENGGIITQKDFANYRTIYREPVKSEYKGHTIYGFPPPSSGGAHVAQVLNILSNVELSKLKDHERYHYLIEAMKLAFADRAHWLGDADFVKVPKGIIKQNYADSLFKKINAKKAAGIIEPGTPPLSAEDLFNKHTTHIATADADGNWVAITTTLNTSFGSKVVVPGTGILLNNQMDDFAAPNNQPNAFGLVGAEANAVEARKRPLSSMSPTLVVKNGKPVMTLGAAGGPTIITQVIQSLVYKLALNKPLEQAVDSIRVHQQWKPASVFVEKRMPEATRKELEKLGHQLRTAGDFGGTQAIAFENGRFIAVTEPRVIRRNQ